MAFPAPQLSDSAHVTVQTSLPDLGKAAISPSFGFSFQLVTPAKPTAPAASNGLAPKELGSLLMKNDKRASLSSVIGKPEIIATKAETGATLKVESTAPIEIGSSASTALNTEVPKYEATIFIPGSDDNDNAVVPTITMNNIPPSQPATQAKKMQVPPSAPTFAPRTKMSSLPQRRLDPVGELDLDDFALPDMYQRPAARPNNLEHVDSAEQWRNRLLGGPSTLTRLRREREARQIAEQPTPSRLPASHVASDKGGKPDVNIPTLFPQDLGNLQNVPPLSKKDEPESKKGLDKYSNTKRNGGAGAIAVVPITSTAAGNVAFAHNVIQPISATSSSNYNDTDMADVPYHETQPTVVAQIPMKNASQGVAMYGYPPQVPSIIHAATSEQPKSKLHQGPPVSQFVTIAQPKLGDMEMGEDDAVVELEEHHSAINGSGVAPRASAPQSRPDQDMSDDSQKAQTSVFSKKKICCQCAKYH